MVLKFILNILYNLCIIICVVVIWSGFKNHNWAYVAGATFIGAMIIIFKLRLIKDVKNMTKKP
ncbi:hypothetical protein BEL04_12135 [Mucilaginibacter sp. PPCGB 2223]|uniref:DUF6358 family protein n=1 Tax=Mucilaginibacter sp. PPCGB 2223 TaxID=1886027 RepID=UPI000824000F|nr:DUF6358 family protein [Mucilaginibacter sp. PPCGB 2223]OCX52227.1 hypothetical protein BEL04_12135 [Mucilaginibacter sp. PPCGB 2223]